MTPETWHTHQRVHNLATAAMHAAAAAAAADERRSHGRPSSSRPATFPAAVDGNDFYTQSITTNSREGDGVPPWDC